MTTHPLDILITESPYKTYIKPLGFMYEPDGKTVSVFEKQVRVRKTSVWYAVSVGILNANNDHFTPISETDISDIDAVQIFLDAHDSIYP